MSSVGVSDISCLDRVIRQGLAQGDSDLQAKLRLVLSLLTFGTLCSGIDGCVVAFDKLSAELGIAPVVHELSCELATWPRMFLLTFGRSNNLFGDATRLVTHDGKAIDARSGDLKLVPGCGMLVAGTVCRQFSALCENSKRATSSENTDSIRTLQGFKDYVHAHTPRIVILENVVQIQPWLVDLHKDFRKIGYLTHDEVVNASDVGVPEDRIRRFFTGVFIGSSLNQDRQEQFGKSVGSSWMYAKLDRRPAHRCATTL